MGTGAETRAAVGMAEVGAMAALICAWVHDDPAAWVGLTWDLHYLDPGKVGALATAALAALPDDLQMDVIDDFAGRSGWPLLPFEGLAEEARSYSRACPPLQRKFYAWALVEAMPEAEARALAAAIGERLAKGVAA